MLIIDTRQHINAIILPVGFGVVYILEFATLPFMFFNNALTNLAHRSLSAAPSAPLYPEYFINQQVTAS
ncbi:MAG: hypothetical protein F4X92_10450 [Gammaproteobacteria bacterium]|nr:hypothetical protein [Gammaproteobacteria bacterium]